MGKEMIFFRDSCTRVKDLEKENKELVKQATIDKKTLITLREVRLTLVVSKSCIRRLRTLILMLLCYYPK